MKEKISILVTCALFLLSCSVAELTPVQQREVVGRYSQTRSLNAVVDSVEMISRIQSDKEVLIMNQVLFRDGRFTLDLSKADAESLGIQDELYDKYSHYVEEINKSLK